MNQPVAAFVPRSFLTRYTDCNVLAIGMVGTEMLYYAVGSRNLDGGVSVTASHNPKQWAGFKLVREGAIGDVLAVPGREPGERPSPRSIGRPRVFRESRREF